MPQTKANLSLPHLILALLVTLVWGSNFVVIHIGLEHFPPILFAALRFFFVFFPLCFFLKRPNVPLKDIALYGILVGGGQFGLLFSAMKLGLSPGLASLIMQVQVFFTIGLAMIIANEKVAKYQIFALLMAASGLVVIAMNGGGEATPIALLLAISGSFCWACSNMIVRKSPQVNMLAYVVWGGVFAFLPLLAYSFLAEGSAKIMASIVAAPPEAWAALAWQSIGNSMFGYAAWGFLLGRYKAATITPIALLIPISGIGASVIFLHEQLQDWKIIAAILVMTGLAINTFWGRWKTNSK